MKSIAAAAILAAALLGACVSLEESSLGKGAVEKDQRTVLLLFTSPGPEIIELDTKVEAAAKFMPGVGLVVQSAQNERDLAASVDLQKYLPKWRVDKLFYPLLMKALASSGHPGKLITPEQANIPAPTLSEFNRADNILDWRLRYYYQNPNGSVPRNYSTLLSLDDALILEVNLAYGVGTDGEGNATPALGAVIKLLRANTMRTLWRHEETLEDKPGTKTLYEFKVSPLDLIAKYEKMLPAMAQRLAQSYTKNLKEAGIFSSPPAELSGSSSTLRAVSASSATAAVVLQSTPTAALIEISTQNYAAPSSTPTISNPEKR